MQKLFQQGVQKRDQVLFEGGKIVLEGSRVKKSKSLFHALCYHNQMDNVCSGKD